MVQSKQCAGAVRSEPTHVEANAILGMLLSRTDAKDEARKYLQQTLQFQPDHALAKQTLRKLDDS